MSDDTKKDKSTVDKIVMGAIIGTAIGSAIGMAAAPQKGKDTRDLLKEKTKDLGGDVKEVGTLTKETTAGIFRLFKNLFFRKKKKKSASEISMQDMRKIPSEMEIIPECLARSDLQALEEAALHGNESVMEIITAQRIATPSCVGSPVSTSEEQRAPKRRMTVS